MALRKPSDFFGKEVKEDQLPEVKSDNTLREELSKVESLSEELQRLQQELSEKVVKNDLESLVLSQINTMHENFERLQSEFKLSNKNDLTKFKEVIFEVTEIVNNLVEEEIPKYKKQITSHEVRLSNQFEDFKDEVEERVQNFYQVLNEFNDVVQVIDNVSNIEKYLQEHHQELIELREEVFGEIENLPLGNLQENLQRLEKKIDYIRDTYSSIDPESVAKEIIQEGLLNEPPETKNEDPLTPLNQNFVTLDQLQEHYRLFINRIQQQLATLGGGGETQLKYLDDVVGIATNASAYDGKFLKYDHSLGKFVFETVSGGGGGGAQGIQGVQGVQGTIGIQGFEGPQGIQGFEGSQGIQGFEGSQGIQGTQGVGSQGTQGTQGTVGAQGIQGVQGVGSQGTQGTVGAQGIQGVQGVQGTIGSQGTQGVIGIQGTIGSQGVQGVQGLSNQGVQGTIGSQGIQGVQGIKGNDGTAVVIVGIITTATAGIGSTMLTNDDTVYSWYPPQDGYGVLEYSGNLWVYGGGIWTNVGQIVGPQGDPGIQGSQGVQGTVGSQGVQGLQGTQGVGSQGVQGTVGSQGVQGLQGTQGVGSQGVQGTVGIQGTQGTQGMSSQGVQGTIGSQGIQGVQGLSNQGVQGTVGSQGPAGGGGGGGVTSIIAGSGISINQSTGDVTITATGGGAGSTNLGLVLASTYNMLMP